MRALDLLGGGEILTEAQCWDLLSRKNVGRLAVTAGGSPDIFPVNFRMDGGSIVIRSNMGHKLLAASNAPVAFEVDHVDVAERFAWSVVVHGRGVVSPGGQEETAWSGPKDYEIRIQSEDVTGRRVSGRPPA